MVNPDADQVELYALVADLWRGLLYRAQIN